MAVPLPSDWRQLWVAMRYQTRSYFRSNRFYVFFGICGGFGLLLLGLVLAGRVLPARFDDPSGVLRVGFTMLAQYFVLALGVVFGADVASMDLGTPAGLYTLPMPVRRTTLLIGRAGAAYALALGCALVLALLVVASGLLKFGTIPGGTALVMTALSALALASALAVSILFGAVFRRGAYGFILAFVLLFIALPVATAIAAGAGAPLAWSLTTGTAVVVEPLGPGGGAVGTSIPGLGEGIAILSAYLAASVVLAVAIFRRREHIQ
jgi:ABC-type transport system involved in multi-copper enzyme maturation permease subunit